MFLRPVETEALLTYTQCVAVYLSSDLRGSTGRRGWAEGVHFILLVPCDSTTSPNSTELHYPLTLHPVLKSSHLQPHRFLSPPLIPALSPSLPTAPSLPCPTPGGLKAPPRISARTNRNSAGNPRQGWSRGGFQSLSESQMYVISDFFILKWSRGAHSTVEATRDHTHVPNRSPKPRQTHTQTNTCTHTYFRHGRSKPQDVCVYVDCRLRF